jgi:hypothetical protein
MDLTVLSLLIAVVCVHGGFLLASFDPFFATDADARAKRMKSLLRQNMRTLKMEGQWVMEEEALFLGLGWIGAGGGWVGRPGQGWTDNYGRT